MTAPIGPVTPSAVDPAERAKLRETAKQLEGLFVRQLFSAMRETVQSEGVVDGGAGEDIFTGLLDESLADATPSRWHRGAADEIVAQLQSRLHAAPPESR